MSGSMIEFFADLIDLKNLFNEIDEDGEFIYTASLSEVDKNNNQFTSASNLIGYLVSYDKPVQTNVFLITLPSTILNERKIRMKDGSGFKTKIDQNYNLDAIEILLGGEAALETIVTTTIRTTGETKIAKDLFRKFKIKMVKKSTKVGANYYVLPNAMEKLRAGWRLTAGIGYSKKLDL